MAMDEARRIAKPLCNQAKAVLIKLSQAAILLNQESDIHGQKTAIEDGLHSMLNCLQNKPKLNTQKAIQRIIDIHRQFEKRLATAEEWIQAATIAETKRLENSLPLPLPTRPIKCVTLPRQYELELPPLPLPSSSSPTVSITTSSNQTDATVSHGGDQSPVQREDIDVKENANESKREAAVANATTGQPPAETNAGPDVDTATEQYAKTSRMEPGRFVPFIEVRVTNPRLAGGSLFGHVRYDVKGVLANQEGSYTAVHRYSSFLELRQAIVKAYPKAGEWLPPLPEKKILGKYQHKVWTAREQGLNAFLFILKEKQADMPVLTQYLHRFFSR
eukprot:TRINITY_DN7339_c0_g2_i1.p1 TRINITY_DN7339_c0_g2~~TRINITY_DN7339_c0_g2_i1.p1  ORF type:complete len:332 (+),score=61.07 TRINITY_DN7339_c0_g2_i1:195-1190(+)